MAGTPAWVLSWFSSILDPIMAFPLLGREGRLAVMLVLLAASWGLSICTVSRVEEGGADKALNKRSEEGIVEENASLCLEKSEI